MATTLYGRSAILRLASNDGIAKVFRGIPLIAQSELFYEDGIPKLIPEDKKVDPFRIAFSVEQTSESNANTAKITVYNVNVDTRRLATRESVRVELSCGYGRDPEILYIGESNADKTVVERDGTNILLNLESGDGRSPLLNAAISKTFEAGASVRQIITDTIASLGLENNPIIKDIEDEIFSHAVTVSDSAKEVLDKYTKKQGLVWSIQNGRVEVRKRKTPAVNEVVLLENLFEVQKRRVADQLEAQIPSLLKGSGLIGIPKRRESGGIEFQSLLNAKIRPGRIVRIKTNREGFGFDGTYIVEKATHSGDSYRGPWFTVAEGIEA